MDLISKLKHIIKRNLIVPIFNEVVDIGSHECCTTKNDVIDVSEVLTHVLDNEIEKANNRLNIGVMINNHHGNDYKKRLEEEALRDLGYEYAKKHAKKEVLYHYVCLVSGIKTISKRKECDPNIKLEYTEVFYSL